MASLWPVAFSVLTVLGTAAQPAAEPSHLLQEADRLAWLRAWTAAAPLYAEAERQFVKSGDQRNALYARIGHLRARLPRLAVPDVSAQLEDYLDLPVVQTDERLRLRCLVIKGEVDEDLDPSLAGKAWREAQELANELGDAAWANRAKGELGVVAFLQGDIGASVMGLGEALKVAQSNGDVSSQVRWLTLFGHGYVELGRPEEALDFYDRALKVASVVPELQFPMMTYVGRANALVRLKRADEADQILTKALSVADRQEARGYQAELLKQQALLAQQRGQTDRALALFARATELARAAGANRIIAEVGFEAAKVQRAGHRVNDADRTLREAIDIARAMQERLLLPRLLAELAELRSSQGRNSEASGLLEEASDLMEGLFTTASSPWVQSRLVSGMNDVFLARIRLEGERKQNLARTFDVVEQARGRSLLELLVNRPVSDQRKPQELRDGERQIAALQKRLFLTTERSARQRLLDQIFVAEERLAPLSTAVFDRTRRDQPRGRTTLRSLQRVLGAEDIFLEFALTDPHSYVIVATATSVRVQQLPGRSALREPIAALLQRIRNGEDIADGSERLAAALLGPVPELWTKRRLVVSPDGELHQLPFELLTQRNGERERLLDSHVVSYVQSGSVLAVLRAGKTSRTPARRTLAVSSSPVGAPPVVTAITAVTRSVYDLDIAKMRPLPAADDEVRSVGSILGAEQTTVLLGDAATEAEVKRQPLQDFQVMHFAVHGIPSTKFPARSALLLRPAAEEDGVLQAREILGLRLNADLVTLSACDTGSGSLHGQDGVASLVRPFIAAGARTVVANLWTADDTFSLALMREFYRQLAAGADIAESLRAAKLRMLEMFGPQAAPRLWSGVLAYGDGAGRLARSAAQTREE
jgi:CHAT domain-containing protein/tetratricopeptide (TPR) repeat protein